MTITEVRKELYDLTARFFTGANIVWVETPMATPKYPYVTLRTSGIKRNTFKDCTGDGTHYFHCNTRFTIDLYTKGTPIKDEDGKIIAYENTSAADLMDFFNYSESVCEELKQDYITLQLDGEIKDLSNLVNDSDYRFRARAESIVYFSQESEGYYGLLDATLPNGSGGGKGRKRFATDEVPIITKLEGDN